MSNFGHHSAAGAEHWTLQEYRCGRARTCVPVCGAFYVQVHEASTEDMIHRAHVEAYLDAIQARLELPRRDKPPGRWERDMVEGHEFEGHEFKHMKFVWMSSHAMAAARDDQVSRRLQCLEAVHVVRSCLYADVLSIMHHATSDQPVPRLADQSKAGFVRKVCALCVLGRQACAERLNTPGTPALP